MVEGKPVSDSSSMYGIYGYLLRGPGTIYFISVLLNAKYCGYGGDTRMNVT